MAVCRLAAAALDATLWSFLTGGNVKGKSLQQNLDVYRAWYRLARSWSILQFVLFACITAMALYILFDKLVFFSLMGYGVVALLVGSIGVLVLVGCYLLLPATPATVSYVVDRAAGLKNLVSSGLGVAGATDEVSAVVEARATHALTRQAPRQLMPFLMNKAGRFLYIPVLLLLTALVVPTVDLFHRQQKREQAKAEMAAVKNGALKLTAKLTSIESQATVQGIDAGKIMKDLDRLSTNLMGVAKQDALLKIGEFENKYNKEFSKERNFEKAVKSADTIPDMKGLSPESQKQLQELAKDFKDAKLGDAAKALRELAKQLESKDLSPEQKKALARELAKMAEKMQGGQMSEDMAKLMRQIEASPEDMEELLKQACDKAGDQMNELAQFADECENLKAMKEGLQDAKKEMMGDSFSGFDAKEVEQYMEGEAQLGEGQGGNGQGQGMGLGVDEGSGSGDGTGGEGQGRGGLPLENRTDTAFKNEMSKSKVNQGKILHQLFVSGIPEKGEAAVEYSDVVQAAKQQAASSLARDRIPREYEDMVKTYFDSLETEKKEKEDDKSAP